MSYERLPGDILQIRVVGKHDLPAVEAAGLANAASFDCALKNTRAPLRKLTFFLFEQRQGGVDTLAMMLTMGYVQASVDSYSVLKIGSITPSPNAPGKY